MVCNNNRAQTFKYSCQEEKKKRMKGEKSSGLASHPARLGTIQSSEIASLDTVLLVFY